MGGLNTHGALSWGIIEPDPAPSEILLLLLDALPGLVFLVEFYPARPAS